jgi:Zn-dependent protease
MGSAFNLGRLFGIRFRLHYTWFILFILVTVSMVYPDWSSLFYWIVAIITSLLFFTSLLAHELAHSLVGRANGIPIKSITLFIFGGVAQMAREAKSAGAELKMAAAGPVCSLVLACLFYLGSVFVKDWSMSVATLAFQQLAYVNVALAAFNLIPGFPLDGGRVFRSILWRVTDNYRRSTRIATRVGQGTGYLFMLGGVLIVFLQPFGLGWFSGLWLTFIGWFLGRTASASYRQAQWHEALQRFTASQLMTTDYLVVASDISVGQLVQEYIITSGCSCFLVADGGEVTGILTLSNIKSIPQLKWGETRLQEIMTPIDKLKTAYPTQNALSVLEQMDEGNVDQMLVVSEGRSIGLITRDNLIRLLRTHSELGL